ncbi:MAG: hypothetical protein IKC64_05610 [Clostridia bacterium]|nr:hypothetical protein [Clostridia bacterium]
MIKSRLKELNLPPFQSKEEMMEIMQREVFGYLPEKPTKVSFKTVEKEDGHTFCAGLATLEKIEITSEIRNGEFTFPVYAMIPKGDGPYPFVVQVNFYDGIPNKYTPVEEIMDQGVAVLMFCYHDVSKDNPDFSDGLAKILYPDGVRKNSTDPGKIAMWAWAAQRVMDYAETNDKLDKNRSAVAGHSRLGKTALLCGATDERFKFVYSNDSGNTGAAISRGKVGEHVDDIMRIFPYWYCENYGKYRNKEFEMPFDQHYLTALSFPRYLYIASAVEDTWADPDSEFLNAYLTGKYYEQNGVSGFVCENRLPQVGDVYHQGTVGYHLRQGAHFLSRNDWNLFIKFLKSKG